MTKLIDSQEEETERHDIIRLGNKRIDAIATDLGEIESDFLGCNKSKSKMLINKDGHEIDVQSLRGKIICLYIAPLHSFPYYLRQFYLTLIQTKHHLFDMVYVARPSLDPHIIAHYSNLSEFNNFLSTMPSHALAVRFDDLDWRFHLSDLYSSRRSYWFRSVCFIDTRNNDYKTLIKDNDDVFLEIYGPQLYPFTPERQVQLREQFYQLGAKDSIKDILGTDSRNYLINGHHERVPLSDLEDKDVALYPYYETTRYDPLQFRKELEDIYNGQKNKGNNNFEIVFINMQYRGGYQDLNSFNIAIAEMPWLALPFDDEKIWNLQDRMLSLDYSSPIGTCWGEFPILFIKPKDKAPLDPYGYQVLQKFGIPAYPFTRKKATSMEMERLKTLTMKSFVETARELGLDFTSLFQNNINAKRVDVSLSTIFPNEGRGRGILLLFANFQNFSEERLNSLITAYSKAKQSSSPFEVIFVSLYYTHQDFLFHFTDGPIMMPWHAYKNPLTVKEHVYLLENTIGFCIPFYCSHFIAFGDDGNLLRVGITKSFDDCDFPFLDDQEYTKHLYHFITKSYSWMAEADNTHPFKEKVAWWNTLCDTEDSDEE